jgi:hypothetical protein
MSCHLPVQAWRSLKGPNPATGKWPLVSKRSEGYVDMEVIRPCGKCIGCRLDYSRSKAVRAMHESLYHDRNCFITLTYTDDYLPYSTNGVAPTIRKKDHQMFLKRLRRAIEPVKIRYMGCAEYGEQNERPHYHDIIFGYDFSDDRVFHSISSGNRLYTSPLLSVAWPYGHSLIGDLTFDSAAYVASYTVKKLTGPKGVDAYEKLGREPPCGFMSLKPAIGYQWIEDYAFDVYSHDSVIVRGHEQRPPRYYDKMFEKFGGDIITLTKNRKKLAQSRLRECYNASGEIRSVVMESKLSKKDKKI